MQKWKRFLILGGLLVIFFIGTLAWQIYQFSFVTSHMTADVAIVLGAAVWEDKPSPVFAERIKHGLTLYQEGRVKYILFTGGIGDGDELAESEVARQYAIEQGVAPDDILIETASQITQQNLYEACQLMAEHQLENALIVSDPLHMKRAIRIAKEIGLKAEPSPTPTTLYKTWRSKLPSLFYETFFYVVQLGSSLIGMSEPCPTA